ncbi:hypothetical protein AQUCO_13500013v1 [Aquilegia coerulea]|uniref:BHLH domain-containing protein n=1 Tax=Aquilegia coerulea TaxID=218851 RepID=A0A2G5C170_AQUCA|nr:hypothetical protein AQUCO_13500013v1 [Aquilegia coerulea]
MRIDALVGGANSKTSGSYLRDIRGKNIIDEIIPLKVIAKSYLLRNVSNDISHNQMSFLPTGSTIIHGGLAKGMPQGLFLPVSSRARQTVFQFEEEIIGNNSGRASDFNATDFSYNMDAKKVSMLGANDNSHKDLQNSHVNLDKDYCDVPTGGELILYGEGGSQRKLLSAANRNGDIDQNHTLTAQEPIREGIKSSQHPAVIPRPTPRKRAATESSSSDRLRRARKTENLKALRELLPHSRKVMYIY